jgi:heat-inducible transcriptional repressor
MLSQRQETLLQFLVKQYLSSAEPVSSEALKKTSKLDVSSATVRNDLQELTEQGFIDQPHTSAGRVPTKKAYQYFAEKMAHEESIFSNFISKEMEQAREHIQNELKLAGELMKSLEKMSSTLSITKITEVKKEDGLTQIMEIISISKTSYGKNKDIMHQIIKELENF